jgi:hypothetical protein
MLTSLTRCWVSNTAMKSRIFRRFRWLLSFSMVTMVSMSGAIRLDQYFFRRRAERLQSDIRLLELRKSTYKDARKFESRWFDDVREGVCKRSWCDLQISLNTPNPPELEFLVKHPTSSSIYRGLGGRVASVYADIQVRDNLLLGKMLSLSVESRSVDHNGRRITYELKGMAGTSPLTSVSARHPEYEIGTPSGCVGCKVGWVRFTSFADPQDVMRLTDINFDCITRWTPCTDEADILSTVWRERQNEMANTAPDRFDSCSPGVIRVLSRESRRLVLATVIALGNGDEGAEVRVRRIPDGRGQTTDQWRELTIRIPNSESVQVGNELLIFDDHACAAALASEVNVRAARQGFAESWASPVRPLGLPFGSFNPPAIDIH